MDSYCYHTKPSILQMAVLFGRNLWKIWCRSIHVWSLSKSEEEVKSHSCFQGKEILHSQRTSSKSSRKKADKTMLFIYFLVNRFNMFKYYYFMLHGQIGKYDVSACTKKNVGSLPFVISVSLLLTSSCNTDLYWPLGHWKCARSYHHSELSLLIEYANSRPAGCVHP